MSDSEGGQQELGEEEEKGEAPRETRPEGLERDLYKLETRSPKTQKALCTG